MGKLQRAMRGTRDAPQVWQEEVRATMSKLGFKECVTQPGIYYHQSRNLYIVSHVDDFLCVGGMKELVWFKLALQEKYEIKAQILSRGNNTVSFLGRKVTWAESGLEIEADKKHVQILLEEWKMIDCNPCDTPLSCDTQGSNEGEPMPGVKLLFLEGRRLEYII